MKQVLQYIGLIAGIALLISSVYVRISYPWVETQQEKQPVFNMEDQQIGYVEVTERRLSGTAFAVIFALIVFLLIIASILLLGKGKNDY